MAILGLGVVNLIIGFVDVLFDLVFLVCIIGQVYYYLLGSDVFQEIDVINCIMLVIKWNYQIILVKEILEVFVKVFYVVNSGCFGLVVIDIIKNVQIEMLDF